LDCLFLDANVLFSAAYREDSPLLRLWERPEVELITSAYALEEAGRHLDTTQQERLEKLRVGVRVVAESPNLPLPAGVELRDKDAPILSAAIAAGATHLITGDRRDFGAQYGRRIGGVLILPPRGYLGRE
jgi:predicted nucleic acid-binding protein